MRSFFANKLWVALVSILALGALMVLAVGLREVSFRRAQSFSRGEAQLPNPLPANPANFDPAVPLQTQLGIVALVVLGIILIGSLLSPEMRKKLFRIAVRVAVTCLALYILFTRYPEVLAQIGSVFTRAANGPAPSANNSVPLPAFTPPPSVSWASYLVSFGIAALLVFLAWKLYSAWKEFNPAASSMGRLAKIARASLRDLSSGRDSTDVIMNCYYRMSDVISDKKNISRTVSMTPNEFALHLEQAGLPADAVRRLTRLFESARYGGRKSDSVSVNEAVACLTTILHHCGEAV